MKASEYGHLETVRTLLKRGATVEDVNNVRNQK